MRVFLITGLSGSGKSCAARALEDEGFFVVDNLPLDLLPSFVDACSSKELVDPDIAVVIDVRNRAFLESFDTTLSSLTQRDIQLEILFFEASRDTLIRRYSETRRRHPLSTVSQGVPEAIQEERNLLADMRSRADCVINTTGLTPHQLRSRVISLVRGEQDRNPLLVRLQSFGFRYGIPLESDLVMDVRFLPNPHFIEELRPLTGLNRAVREHVLSQDATKQFLERIQDMLGFLLPCYVTEGKSYLTISIGCTGGRHRSVSVVEELRSFLAGEGVSIDLIHRDLDRV
ncbi:MAG: RNase adapter RapZ [Desulfuromonas sp.]|nr:MAG: RNase adapter RapZ [Desulfuromonas sp.]